LPLLPYAVRSPADGHELPPTKPVTLLDSDLSEMSKNETPKVEGEGLFRVAASRTSVVES
jgi:hypothetical protein